MKIVTPTVHQKVPLERNYPLLKEHLKEKIIVGGAINKTLAMRQPDSRPVTDKIRILVDPK